MKILISFWLTLNSRLVFITLQNKKQHTIKLFRVLGCPLHVTASRWTFQESTKKCTFNIASGKILNDVGEHSKTRKIGMVDYLESQNYHKSISHLAMGSCAAFWQLILNNPLNFRGSKKRPPFCAMP